MTTTTLTREWVNGLQDKANQALLDHDWPTLDTYDNCAVRIDLVESRCRYEGQTIAGRFRVCQTWVTVEGAPQLAAVQYTSSDGGAGH
jgi:hypothetical protein